MPRWSLFLLIAPLMSACSLEPIARPEPDLVQSTDWTHVDVGNVGQWVYVDASPFSVTAVVSYNRVYDSLDAVTWDRVDIPDFEIVWAGRTRAGMVLITLKGVIVTEQPDTGWSQCKLPAAEDVTIVDAIITEDHIFVTGSVDEVRYLWMGIGECAWERLRLPRPEPAPDGAYNFRSVGASMIWIDGELRLMPYGLSKDDEWYVHWTIDPVFGHPKLIEGHPVGYITTGSGRDRTETPSVQRWNEAGSERIDLTVVEPEAKHIASIGIENNGILTVVGSMPSDSDNILDDVAIIAWSPGPDDSPAGSVALFVPGVDPCFDDIVVFGDALIVGGNFVPWIGFGGRRPLLLVHRATDAIPT